MVVLETIMAVNITVSGVAVGQAAPQAQVQSQSDSTKIVQVVNAPANPDSAKFVDPNAVPKGTTNTAPADTAKTAKPTPAPFTYPVPYYSLVTNPAFNNAAQIGTLLAISTGRKNGADFISVSGAFDPVKYATPFGVTLLPSITFTSDHGKTSNSIGLNGSAKLGDFYLGASGGRTEMENGTTKSASSVGAMYVYNSGILLIRAGGMRDFGVIPVDNYAGEIRRRLGPIDVTGSFRVAMKEGKVDIYGGSFQVQEFRRIKGFVDIGIERKRAGADRFETNFLVSLRKYLGKGKHKLQYDTPVKSSGDNKKTVLLNK